MDLPRLHVHVHLTPLTLPLPLPLTLSLTLSLTLTLTLTLTPTPTPKRYFYLLHPLTTLAPTLPLPLTRYIYLLHPLIISNPLVMRAGMWKTRPTKVWPEWRRAGFNSAIGFLGRHLGVASLGQSASWAALVGHIGLVST